MERKFQFKRGPKSRLAKLSLAEVAFTDDEKKLYVGDGTENIRLLDQKDKSEIASALADTENKVKDQKDVLRNNITVASQKKVPLITFIDDDTRDGVWSRLKPIFETRNVPCCVAAITGRFDDPKHLNAQQLRDLQNIGWEVLGHTNTHPTTQNGLQEFMNDYDRLEFEIGSGCKDVLENEGIQVDGFVYPQSGHTPSIREVTKKYYTYALGDLGINDKDLMDSMVITRIALGFGTELNPTMNGNNEKNTLAYYKACIDYAVANNAWLIFMTHVSAQTSQDDIILGQTIDYAKSINVPIVTAREAYKTHGNRYFAGDVKSGNYFIVNKDNKVLTTSDGMKSVEIAANSKTLTDKVDTYELKAITYMKVSNSHAKTNGFPTGNGGFLVTYRLDPATTSYNRQEYWPYFSNERYIRSLIADGSWGTFDEYALASKLPTQLKDMKTANLAVPEIVVPANGYIDTTIPLAGIKATKTQISGNPTWTLAANLMYNIFIVSDGTIAIRIYNFGSTQATVTARNWLFSYINNM